MRKIARKALTASAVAATAIALTAMPASATHFPISVQNGGYLKGVNSGSIIGFGNINGSTLECTSSEATGYTQKDSSGNPIVSGSLDGDKPVALLDSVSFSSPGEVNDWCVANGSIPTQVTATGLEWEFWADGSPSGGVTQGKLEKLQVLLHAPSVPCDATLGGPNVTDGFIAGQYTNPTPDPGGSDGTLDVPFGGANNLEVLSVSGPNCAGLISLGETVAIAGSYTVTRTGPVPPPAGISPSFS